MLRGTIAIHNDCKGTQPSLAELGVILRNAEHEVKLDQNRITMFGGIYRLRVNWPVAYGPPTEWAGLKVGELEGKPICTGGCASGSCSVTTSLPSSIVVKDGEPTTTFNIDYRCGCS